MSDAAVRIRARVGQLDLDVTLEPRTAPVTALVGPNGAGKSATFAALLGHIGPTLLLPPVGWSPQRGGLLPRLRPREQVARFARGCSPLGGPDDVAALLVTLGIDPDDRRRADELSVGEAQRVAVARALFAASLALLDEPTAAQDAAGAAAVRRAIRRYADLGGHVVVASHQPEDAHALADRLVVIEAGRVTQVGTPAELAAAPASTYVARVAGATVLDGTVDGHELIGDWGRLTVPDGTPSGPAAATIRPAAVALHPAPPTGSSARNVLVGRVVALLDTADAVLVRLDTRPPLIAALTHAAARDLDLHPGSEVAATVKANDITVTPR
ncbi:MAG: ATP-binding cassette domain-containing protein [Actinobacteria bacterium]|nr:ATP-binding cassette domain-containing protein [Actinomycetota bacterium]